MKPCAVSVFPTHVGVFPSQNRFWTAAQSLPHARGGVSFLKDFAVSMKVSSPRTWGCFLNARCFSWGLMVFPTHVGVFLYRRFVLFGHGGLPHARGGVSLSCRGCVHDNPVFPTHVGVFLPLTFRAWITAGLPHARGGVSEDLPYLEVGAASSPRTWGCFHRYR